MNMADSYLCQIFAFVSAQFTGVCEGRGKGKSIPTRAWADAEGF
jgi:hypothetical protein